jgi:hypothetical protein
VRRRLVFTSALLVALAPAGAALATTPPDTEPVTAPTSEPVSSETVPVAADTAAAPVDTAVTAASAPAATEPTATAPAPASIYNEDGNVVATVTVQSVDPDWADYDEDNAPDAGLSYVRAVVTVQSEQASGTFSVATDDFIIQDNQGFVGVADTVPSSEQAAADEDLTSDADLANGESVELELTFQVTANVGGQSIFYRPGDDQLVDIAELTPA